MLSSRKEERSVCREILLVVNGNRARVVSSGLVRREANRIDVAQTHRLHHRGGREGVGASPFGVYGAPLEHRWQLTAHDVPPTKLCSPTWLRS